MACRVAAAAVRGGAAQRVESPSTQTASAQRASAVAAPSDGSIFENFGAVAAAKPWRSPFLDEDVDVRLILGTAIKFADLGHAVKPYALHTNWSIRISKEFWDLGDREAAMGVTISPLCDREADKNIAKSQLGFFKFIFFVFRHFLWPCGHLFNGLYCFFCCVIGGLSSLVLISVFF